MKRIIFSCLDHRRLVLQDTQWTARGSRINVMSGAGARAETESNERSGQQIFGGISGCGIENIRVMSVFGLTPTQQRNKNRHDSRGGS